MYGVRQAEKQTAQPLVDGPSTFESEMAIDKLKRHRKPGIFPDTSSYVILY